MHSKLTPRVVIGLAIIGASSASAQIPSESELAQTDTPAGLVDGGGWRLELEAGRGYEKSVRPAPPDSLPPPPSGSLPPPAALPPTPSASLSPSSPGNDHFNKLQLAANWRYRSPEPSTAVVFDWPVRLQAMLTRYDTFSYANRDELTIDTMPAWIYGNNETRLLARFMNTREDSEAFLQEYSLRLLQSKILRPPYGFAFGMDLWEQKFAHDLIALEQDRQRHRMVAGVVGNYSRHSRFALLVTAGRDKGLRDRDDYDVRGLELKMRTALADRLTLMLVAEYEEGDSVQSSDNSLRRRLVDLRTRYQISPTWLVGFGYKLDGFDVGDFSMPTSERYEVTFGLAL